VGLAVKFAIFVLTAFFLAMGGNAAPAAKKKAPAKKSAKAPARKPTANAAPKRAPSRSSRYARSRKRYVAPRPVLQAQPAPERYKEIQQALIERGYLAGEPTGEWKADSVEALKRFQQDQKLDSNGKLDALSLIALGLGPKRIASAQTPSSSQ
jgi:peptidoglycan hydrolase-like protein with peptidoglycan-binding domain